MAERGSKQDLELVSHLLGEDGQERSRIRPVVKISSFDKGGDKFLEEFAKVGRLFGSERHLTVDLDIQISLVGAHSAYTRVGLDTLKAGFWEESGGIKRVIEFVGYTNDQQHTDRKWSYDDSRA